MSIQLPMFDFSDGSIYEYTRCSICNGQLKDPRQLSCLHTFCLDCLEDYTNIDYQTKDSKHGNSLLDSFLHKTTYFGGGSTNNKNNSRSQFKCPVCCTNITAPIGGLSKLPVNEFFKTLLDVYGTSDKKDSHANVLCQICRGTNLSGSSKTAIVAIKFCSECKQHLCQKCVEYHRLLSTTSSHKLLTMGSEQEIMHRLDDVFCEVHTSEIVDIYCKTCNKALCRLCFSTSDHYAHSGCGVLEASLEFKQQIKKDSEDLSLELDYVKKNLREVDEVLDRFNSSIENIENSIQNKEEELKVVLAKHSEKLKRELEGKKYSFNRELDRTKQSLKSYQVVLEEYFKYSQLLLYKATPSILVSSAKNVSQRFKQIKKIAPLELSCEIEPFFTPSKIATETVLNRKMSICGGVPAGTIRNKISSDGVIDDNLIGFLEFKSKFSKKSLASLTITKQPVVMQTYSCSDFAIALTLVNNDESGDFICCATYSSDELSIKEATAFKSDESKKQGVCKNDPIKVKGLKNPFSMSLVGDYLFISEWQNDKLHKIKVFVELTSVEKDDESSTYECLQLGTNEGLNALSTTLDNKYLIVTCPEVDKIKFVDVNGVLIRTILLDSSINKPYHTIQLNNDESFSITQTLNETNATVPKEQIERFAISQCGEILDRICLIDGFGTILATYGSLKGGPSAYDRKMSTLNMNAQQMYFQQQEQLSGPYRMCADLANNLIFVSDHYNHRILLLDSRNLKHIRELISPTFGLSYPLDLCFDTNRQFLHVADLDNKRFISFKFNS